MRTPVASLPSVAILLATYNGGAFVADQVHSILSQTAVRVHIFVRDDGSTDDTIDVITRVKNEHPEHITILNDGLGPTGSAAANFFALMQIVDFGSFNYVAFADQDDVWLPEKLQRAVTCLSHQGGGGYSSNLLAWNVEDDTYWIMQKSGAAKKFDYLFQGASAGCTYVLDVASALIVRQRMAPLKRQYCAGISHDWVIYAICRSAGVPWFRDTQSLIHYRQHSGNVYGARPGFAGMAARLGMISSGWYRDHVLWLEHVITNTADERKLLARLKRGRINDCFYLATQARDFRRDRVDVWKLRIALILGLLGNKGG